MSSWTLSPSAAAERRREPRTSRAANERGKKGGLDPLRTDAEGRGDVNPLESPVASDDRFITVRQRAYSELIFSSLSRVAVMDSSTELVPLIHAPPSRRRSSGKGP
jgi:hypothetical protein